MRDPNRLYKFYEELERIHCEFEPSLTFLQFVCGFMAWTQRDPFFYEDDDILEAFKKWANENPHPGREMYNVAVYTKLRDLHFNVPDWRFGQLMVNLIGWVKEADRQEVERIDDSEFLENVEEVMEQWKRA